MTHSHEHHGGDELADMFTAETWDARYAESERIWSGRPNARLVEHVTDLTPGDALDVGAGEGADSVWLASQGWNVTALDVSRVALDKAAAHAAESGVAERVTTVQHDLMGDAPLPGSYDLVSVHFWHPPVDRFAEVYQRLGAAVRPQGALLVVGHHPVDVTIGVRSAHGHPELLFTPEKLVGVLAAEEWDIRFADAQSREVAGEDGPVTMTDTVVLAARR